MILRRLILTGGVLIMIAAVLAIGVLNPRVEQKLFERGAANRASRSNASLLNDDAVHVAIAGSAPDTFLNAASFRSWRGRYTKRKLGHCRKWKPLHASLRIE